MSEDFEAAWKKHVKVHSHNIPPTPCCLECREPWPCTVRLLLAKVREQAEEIERLKAELAAERANTWRLAGEVVERDQLLAAEQRGRAAERAHRERLEKLLLDIADDATDGPINRGLNSVQAVLEWREAMRPAAQPCTIEGCQAIHPAAPEPTPSVKRCDCPVPDCQHHRGLIPYPAAGSEQPDLPLGHEFVAGHPHPAYQSYCALRGIFGLCGQPESAHRGKP